MVRKLTFLIMLLSGTITLSAGVPNYKIGFFLPLKGFQSVMGISIKEGIEAYIHMMKADEANNLHKFTLEAVLFDTESQIANAIKIIDYVTKKQEQYLLLAGGTTQSEVGVLQKLAQEKQIPYLFPVQIAFKERLEQFYFPVLPTLYQGYSYLIKYFKSKNIEFKILYDDKTRENAFLLGPQEVLLDVNDKEMEKKLGSITILYLDDANVEKALEKIQGKTIAFMNYNQLNLAATSKNQGLWEEVNFLNWIKAQDREEVKFFVDNFKAKFNREPDNYHMIGWIMAELIYEGLFKAVEGKSDGIITRREFMDELEKFGDYGGFNNGCGYKILYSPFSMTKDESRGGISGIYFMKFSKGNFYVISDFLDIFSNP